MLRGYYHLKGPAIKLPKYEFISIKKLLYLYLHVPYKSSNKTMINVSFKVSQFKIARILSSISLIKSVELNQNFIDYISNLCFKTFIPKCLPSLSDK